MMNKKSVPIDHINQYVCVCVCVCVCVRVCVCVCAGRVEVKLKRGLGEDGAKKEG